MELPDANQEAPEDRINYQTIAIFWIIFIQTHPMYRERIAFMRNNLSFPR